MTRIKLHTSIIRNGVYWAAGSEISVNDAEATELSKYGVIVKDKPERPVAPPPTEEAPPPADKPKTVPKGKK